MQQLKIVESAYKGETEIREEITSQTFLDTD